MTVLSLETDGRSRRLRAGWCAKAHGGATTKSSGSSHERHSLAFAGRAVESTVYGQWLSPKHRICVPPVPLTKTKKKRI